MEVKFVLHPKKIKRLGYTFEVASLTPLTDQEALRTVRVFCLTHRLLKKHQRGVIRVMTLAEL